MASLIRLKNPYPDELKHFIATSPSFKSSFIAAPDGMDIFGCVLLGVDVSSEGALLGAVCNEEL